MDRTDMIRHPLMRSLTDPFLPSDTRFGIIRVGLGVAGAKNALLWIHIGAFPPPQSRSDYGSSVPAVIYGIKRVAHRGAMPRAHERHNFRAKRHKTAIDFG